MSELTASHVFDVLRPTGSGDGVGASERVGLGLATVMLRPGKSSELFQKIKQGFGIELGNASMRYASGPVSFIGTGNGKWLAVLEDPARHSIDQLAVELDGLASVVDQSHAFGVLRLSGSSLLGSLEKGVQIDLSPAVFPAGSAAVTNIHRIGVTLWKIDDAPTIDIAVTRSMAGSFCHWLQASAAVYGLTVREPLQGASLRQPLVSKP